MMRRAVRGVLLLALLSSTAAFHTISKQSSGVRLQPPHIAAAKPFHVRGGTTTSIQAASVVLPSLKTVAVSCLLPTSLGYYRSEYGVSYGYGTSVALVAFLILRQLERGSVPYWHALALVFYGIRLNLFLLYRELCIPLFREFREKIEERARNKGNRLARTPFLVSCAALYSGLTAPLFVTSQVTQPSTALKVLVACSWLGFLVAAVGDFTKSVVKARQGQDVLVRSGIFKFLRHPNYSGEAFGWTASFLAAVASVEDWSSNGVALVASALGWAGIVFVLAMAATGLERKQKEKYGDSQEYKDWVRGSWAGPTLKMKKSE